uniref:Uncharacterized protein n=1 Tax=Oryzias sinensis TaxID=183150 RepID=A0A8C7YNV9_9TELE
MLHSNKKLQPKTSTGYQDGALILLKLRPLVFAQLDDSSFPLGSFSSSLSACVTKYPNIHVYCDDCMSHMHECMLGFMQIYKLVMSCICFL